MFNRRGQSPAEYAVLISVVIGALLAMQIYMKRGAMGRLKDASDQMGEQFSPLHTNASANKHYEVTRQEVTTNKGQVTSNITSNEIQSSTGGTVDVQGLKTENLY